MEIATGREDLVARLSGPMAFACGAVGTDGSTDFGPTLHPTTGGWQMGTEAATDADRAKWARPLRDEEVQVNAGPVSVGGHLTIPLNPRGIVVFAHGGGSSRFSPRN